MMNKALLCMSLLVATLVGLGISEDAVVRIEPNVRELLVSEGSQERLLCVVEHHSSNTDTVGWHRPYNSATYPDEEGQLSQKRNSDGTFTTVRELIIPSFNRHYNGSFVCLFNHEGGSTQSEIVLKLVTESKPENPVYHFGDETVTFFCNAQLSTNAKFKSWLKDEKVLEDGEKYTVHTSNHSLTIKKLDRDDAGKYIARYDLNEGKDSTYDCVVEYKAGPLVLDMDKSVNGVEGDSVVITCDVKGWPHADVYWLKDGEVLTPNRAKVQYTELNELGEHKVTINDLESADEGQYTCRAYSREFNETSEKTIKLRVKGKLAWLWPFIGIIIEVIVLVLLIFCFEKFKKGGSANDHPHEQ